MKPDGTPEEGDAFDDIVYCTVQVVRKSGGTSGLTAPEVLACWQVVTKGSRPEPDVATVRAAMVVGVEQRELVWVEPAPNGEVRAVHYRAREGYIPYNAGWDEK